MAHHPNFSAQLSDQELETLRKLSAQLGLTLANGQRAGEGSPRRLLQELARSAQKNGLKRTAEALRPLFPTDKPA